MDVVRSVVAKSNMYNQFCPDVTLFFEYFSELNLSQQTVYMHLNFILVLCYRLDILNHLESRDMQVSPENIEINLNLRPKRVFLQGINLELKVKKYALTMNVNSLKFPTFHLGRNQSLLKVVGLYQAHEKILFLNLRQL